MRKEKNERGNFINWLDDIEPIEKREKMAKELIN